jgi:hypothetical protein
MDPTTRASFLYTAIRMGVIEIAEASVGTRAHCHWDYAMDIGTGLVRICTRPLEAPEYPDVPVKMQSLCVELHGERPADPGWLFGGKADLVVFQTHDKYLLVDRKVLCSYVSNLGPIIGRQSGPEMLAWIPLVPEFYLYPDLVYVPWKK